MVWPAGTLLFSVLLGIFPNDKDGYVHAVPHRVDRRSKNEIFKKPVAMGAQDEQVGPELVDRPGDAIFWIAEAKVGICFKTPAGQFPGVVKEALRVISGLFVPDLIA